MSGKNCPNCGGFEKQGRFVIFRCTKCLNRYKAQFRGFLAGVASVGMPLLLVVAILCASLFGYTMYQLDRTIDELEQTVTEELTGLEVELEGEIAQLEKAVDEFEAELQRFEEELDRLEQEISELEAEVEQLERLVEELQQQAESPETKVVVKQGDTVWDLLTQELGRYPTWEEIQKVVDGNGLESFMNSQGLWIVLVYPGQVLDLSPALGG